MTATKSVRTAVIDALVTALKAKPVLANIQTSEGWPGKSLEHESVWVGKVTGLITFPLMMAGRKIRDDHFTVTIIFMSGNPGDTISDANDRVETYYGALEDIFADDQTLGSLDGVLSILLDQVEGPRGAFTDEGATSYITADIAVHARYS
jgi:hypothetical protein